MAGTLNDQQLQGTGGPTVMDGLLAYYRANGATATNFNDAQRQWYELQTGLLNADFMAFPGLTGTLNDRMLQYWSSVNVPVPPSSTLPNDLLFALGEKGFWLFPDDLSTLFQDSAGTIPVTTTGQSVGLIKDKSPNHWDFMQPNNLFRPTLQLNGSGHKVLEFNGIDQWMVSNVVDLASSQVTVFVGLRKITDTVAGSVIELSATAVTNNGTFLISAPASAGQPTFSFRTRGTVGITRTAVGFPAPASAVLVGIADIIAPVADIRVNGVGAPGAGSQGTGPYLPYQMFMGRRAGTGIAFQGQINELIVRGAATPTPTVQQLEAYLTAQL
jgi:hypothetical protein